MSTFLKYGLTLLLSLCVIIGCSYVIVDQFNAVVGTSIEMPVMVETMDSPSNPSLYQVKILDYQFQIDGNQIKNQMAEVKETIQSILDKVQYIHDFQ